jgi:alkylated DNA repair protein alkB family protein 6
VVKSDAKVSIFICYLNPCHTLLVPMYLLFPTFNLTPRNLESYRVGPVPTVYYIPEFVSLNDEAALLAAASTTPWLQLSTRQLQLWSTLAAEDNSFKPSGLPPWLQSLINGLVASDVFPPAQSPNHVLINRYQSSQGILHHTDGPRYEPRTAILSLQSSCIMTFRKR